MFYCSEKSYSQTVFAKTYQSDTEIENVWQTADKGYIAGGYSKRWDTILSDWNYDHYILKTDSLGEIEWEKNLDFTKLDGGCIHGSIVRELNNSGFVYVSCINCAQNPPNELSKYLLVKLSSDGDTLWTKTYQRPKRSMGQWVEPTADGGFVMTGYAADNGTSADVFIIKTDSMGDERWRKSFQLYGEDQGSCVRQTSDGGYIIAAGSVYAYPEVHTWILKLNSEGDTLWTKIFPWGMWNVNAFIDITPDNGYIVAVKDSDYYQVAFKVDNFGALQWMQNFGQGNGCITQTADHGFALFGVDSFIKIDENGNIITQKNNSIYPVFWQQTLDKGYILSKENKLIKTDCIGNSLAWDFLECPISNTTIVESLIHTIENEVKMYPNPAKEILSIEGESLIFIQITNNMGIVMFERGLDNSKKININITGWTSGVYYVKVIDSESATIRKIIHN